MSATYRGQTVSRVPGLDSPRENLDSPLKAVRSDDSADVLGEELVSVLERVRRVERVDRRLR